MTSTRIIAKLDIKGPNVVKGIQLEGLRVLGKTIDFATAYYRDGADELIYMDAVASLFGRDSLLDIVRKTARGVFVPLTVGGGIRDKEDIKNTLRAGADKVGLNTAAVSNPELINEAARTFGASTIVVSIEAMKHGDGEYEAYTDYGREPSGRDVFQWAEEVQSRGAGEILLTAVKCDGTRTGFDIDLVRRVAGGVSIPVIAAGGAGSPSDVGEVLTDGLADAASIASALHYDLITRIELDEADFAAEGNVEYLKAMKTKQDDKRCSLGELKSYLSGQNIEVRMMPEGRVE